MSNIYLKITDLPLFCPNKNIPLWDYHPRIFLDLDHQHTVRCPYCGNTYELIKSSSKAANFAVAANMISS